MWLSSEVSKKAFELSSKVSNQRWKECMDRWNALPKEEQAKYNQLVGFNDISDIGVFDSLVADDTSYVYNKYDRAIYSSLVRLHILFNKFDINIT